jgi:hypothetical protein
VVVFAAIQRVDAGAAFKGAAPRDRCSSIVTIAVIWGADFLA